MKALKWIVAIIAAIAICSGCKTTQTATSTDTEVTHITVYDTTRVVNTVMVVDTAHTEYYHTSTTHTVEYYDPTTGQLRQRVIDQQSNIQMLKAQLLSMQMMLDSMRYMRADTSHVVTHDETEEVVDKRSWRDDFRDVLAICLILIFFALFFVRR